MLKEKFRELEKLLLFEIRSHYGERLISVVVFGSVACETQTFDSDLDFLIIAKGGAMPGTGILSPITNLEIESSYDQ